MHALLPQLNNTPSYVIGMSTPQEHIRTGGLSKSIETVKCTVHAHFVNVAYDRFYF